MKDAVEIDGVDMMGYTSWDLLIWQVPLPVR